MQERYWELLRLSLAIILGFLLLQLGGWLFSSGIIRLTSVRPEQFVKSIYNPAAIIVFFASFLGAVLWWIIAVFQLRPKFVAMHDTKTARFFWWGIFLVTVSIAGLCLYIYGNSTPQIIPWMLGSLTLIMAINHWLATALSTPFILAHTVPGAQWLQSLLKIN
ncbi:MAG: hypothetical protein AAGA60_26455 [Cyanobacteria bacterium P01_E01_bin.42]